MKRGSAGSTTGIQKYVDHSETYGAHIIASSIITCRNVTAILDIGAGTGRDLMIAKKRFPNAVLAGIDCNENNLRIMESNGILSHNVNIESEKLPFENNAFDFIIINQVLEHTKEIFWIFHEITRVLKRGGKLIVGVPNIASLHNRMLLMFGKHPTQSKACSAHVRCFSKNDFLLFLEESFPQGYALTRFSGSQFYPFPKNISRFLAAIFPSLAFSIFFELEKKLEYSDAFLRYPKDAELATNFKTS